AGSLHGAGLHDAVVLARGLNHFLAFLYVDARRLLDVDVLSRLAGFYHHVGVPVVGLRDADGVERLVGEDLAEVAARFWLESALGRGLLGAFQVWTVDVTERGDLDV